MAERGWDQQKADSAGSYLDEEEVARLNEEFNWAQQHHMPIAQDVTADLMSQIIERDRPPTFESLRKTRVFSADIEENLEKLDGQVRHMRNRESDALLCASVGDLPVPLSAEEVWRQRNTSLDSAEPNAWSWTPIGEALENVGRQLTGFLANRLASRYFAIRGFAGGMSNTPNLLSVTVSSRSLGARVSYSPAYFINYVALAAPTSPVQGMILPGRYIFMLTTPAPRKVRDQQVFDIPPSFNIPLMV